VHDNGAGGIRGGGGQLEGDQGKGAEDRDRARAERRDELAGVVGVTLDVSRNVCVVRNFTKSAVRRLPC
jgi:hypothetical protein